MIGTKQHVWTQTALLGITVLLMHNLDVAISLKTFGRELLMYAIRPDYDAALQ